MSQQNVDLMKSVLTDGTDLVEVFDGGIEGLSNSPVAGAPRIDVRGPAGLSTQER